MVLRLWLFLFCFILVVSAASSIITKEYVCKHLKHLFPRQVSYNRFVELEKEVLLPLTIFIKKPCWGAVLASVLLTLSLPLHLCYNQRILIHKIFKGLAECGKCSMG